MKECLQPDYFSEQLHKSYYRTVVICESNTIRERGEKRVEQKMDL